MRIQLDVTCSWVLPFSATQPQCLKGFWGPGRPVFPFSSPPFSGLMILPQERPRDEFLPIGSNTSLVGSSSLPTVPPGTTQALPSWALPLVSPWSYSPVTALNTPLILTPLLRNHQWLTIAERLGSRAPYGPNSPLQLPPFPVSFCSSVLGTPDRGPFSDQGIMLSSFCSWCSLSKSPHFCLRQSSNPRLNVTCLGFSWDPQGELERVWLHVSHSACGWHLHYSPAHMAFISQRLMGLELCRVSL